MHMIVRTGGLASTMCTAMLVTHQARINTPFFAGEKLQLQLKSTSSGYMYLLHVNEKDELKLVFPNK